jgi:hypothetical protein
LFKGVDMIEVKLKTDEDVIRETLTRMGILDKRKKYFYPTAYISTINDTMFLLHFKEMFQFFYKDGAERTDYTEHDKLRLNTIAFLLTKWGLVEIVDESLEILTTKIDVISHSEKANYKIINKFKLPD